MSEHIEPMRSRTFSRGQINRKTKTLEEENTRLRDMLQQALSREADVLRKMKHLQMKYLQLLSKTNGASVMNTKSPLFSRELADCKVIMMCYTHAQLSSIVTLISDACMHSYCS